MSTRYSTASDEERALAIDAATLCLQRGELAVLPTDTVYGIAADAFDADAVSDLLQAKGRGRAMPPPVLVSAPSTLDALTVKVPSWARELVAEFWPGALTIVCRAQSSLQWDLGDTRGTVAVRMPDHALALEVLERTGPLAVSSANLTGEPAAVDADRAEEMVGYSVRVIIDDGPSPGGAASTIVDVTRTPGRLLREGAISLDDLNALLDPLGVPIPLPDAADDPVEEPVEVPAGSPVEDPVEDPADEDAWDPIWDDEEGVEAHDKAVDKAVDKADGTATEDADPDA